MALGAGLRMAGSIHQMKGSSATPTRAVNSIRTAVSLSRK